ncbi:hypothetical protein ACFL60_09015 [Candidatus Omnitrophota bacterium]
MKKHFAFCGLLLVLFFVMSPEMSAAEILSDETLLTEKDDVPDYLKDRGEGVPLSMFGTYITKGQFYLYPFFEYYHDSDSEYSPDELGYTQVFDYRGNKLPVRGFCFSATA